MRKTTILAVLILMTAVSAALAADKVYTLQDAYDAALKTNDIVKIAEESVLQSDFIVDKAWTFIYPHLDALSNYTRFNETLPPGGGAFLFQPLDQVQAALVLTQPIYTGGRTLAALHTAQKLQERSRNNLSVTKQSTLIHVAEAYYGVLKAQKSVEISRHSLERMERHKLVTEREAETRKSKANMSALLRANTLVNQARISLVRSQDGLNVAREKLTIMTTIPQDAAVTEPSPPERPVGGLDDLKSAALKNRDDYARSQLDRSIAEENVTIVRGSHYPQLAAVAALQYQTSNPAIFTDAMVYFGGLRLQIPVFEGGLMKAEVSEAKSKVRQAALAVDSLRLSIESDVHEAYVNLQTVESVLATAKLQMGYAKDNFDVVEDLFSEGMVPSLSMIDAEQALNLAENEMMNAAYDRQLAILRLKKSIGALGKENP